MASDLEQGASERPGGKTAAAIGLSSGGDPLSGALGPSLARSMEKDRAAENANIKGYEETYESMKALGYDELGRYEDVKLRPEQATELASFKEDMGAQSANFFQEAGMANGAQEIAAMKSWSDDVRELKYNMEQATKQEAWAHAMQSLGLSQEAARKIAYMHTQDREEKIQIYSSLMGAVGGMMSKKSGGK
jgi:hypothetical protein